MYSIYVITLRDGKQKKLSPPHAAYPVSKHPSKRKIVTKSATLG